MGKEDALKEIKDLIGSGYTSDAIVNLRAIISKKHSTNPSSTQLIRLEETIIALQANLNDIETGESNGTLNKQYIGEEKARIRITLLKIITSLIKGLNQTNSSKAIEPHLSSVPESQSLRTVELTINDDFESYSEKDQRNLLQAIKHLLNMDDDLNIKKIRKGSVKISIDIPNEKYKLLLKKFRDGSLDQYNVIEIDGFKNDQYPKHTKTKKYLNTEKATAAKKIYNSKRKFYGKGITKTKNIRVASSIEGKIQQIFLIYESATERKGLFIPFLLNLIKTFDHSVNFIFWTYDIRSAVELQGLLWEAGNNSKIYNRENDFVGITTDDIKFKIISYSFSSQLNHDSVWIQNDFLVLGKNEDSEIPLIRLPDGYGRKNRALAADLRTTGIFDIVKENDFKFHFASGNILVGSDYLLLGEDDFRKTLRITRYRIGDIEEEEARREIKNLLGVERIIVLGLDEKLKFRLPQSKHYEEHICDSVFSTGMNSFQPFKHLDLFISLLGKINGLETVMIAKVYPLNQSSNALRKGAKILNEMLRIIVRKLENEGFIIIRNRIPIYTEGEESKFRYAFYNNCLVELYKGRKRVYLAEYGDIDSRFLKYDKRNMMIWEQLGFEVTQVGNLLPFSKKNGGLRDLVKCWRRQ